MSNMSKIAAFAALATIIGAPAHAAPPVKHIQSVVLTGCEFPGSGRTTGPTSGRDWQLEGRLRLIDSYSGQ